MQQGFEVPSSTVMQPMIKVEDLTKRYAGATALNGVSFEVQRGEIVGFLGPNGAGKSTTMRILTGFIPASSGRVQVAGLDVFEHSLEVRERVGYMPENNPLYTDMRVSEYLKFRAKLKRLPRSERQERIPEVMELTGIKDVSHRIIGHLSKGYRQRVGLADALLAEPDLLILDEPTIGLDPVQIRQVRQLIKDLGKRHTILLSTHILPEVEMTCNRVIIIHHGRILASDTPESLTKTLNAGGLIQVEVRGPGLGSAGQTPRGRECGIDRGEVERGRLSAGDVDTQAGHRPAREGLSGGGKQWVDAAGIDALADDVGRHLRANHA